MHQRAPDRPRRARSQLSFGAAVLLFAGSLSIRAEDPAIVFVSRDLPQKPAADERVSAIEKARSGKLMVRASDGDLRVLVDATLPGAAANTPVDVADPDISHDGQRIVFSGYSEADGAWRIFEIGADGAGLRQITRSDRNIDLSRHGAAASLLQGYDDVDPCYLPDGRICLVSTRYPGVAPDGRLRSTNLYVVNADGSDLHRITTERFGADTPTVEPATGRIVYSRWWRTAQAITSPGQEPPDPIPPGSPGYGDVEINESDLVIRSIRSNDFPGVNSWFLAGINPDGTGLAMFSGFRLDRELTQAYRPSFLPDGEVLALFISETPFIGYPMVNGLRRYSPGAGTPVFLGGLQSFGNDTVEPDGTWFYYSSAVAMDDGRILVTGASGDSSYREYGVYTQSGPDAQPAVLYDAGGTAELDAVLLGPRPTPPVIEDTITDRMVDTIPRNIAEARAQGGTFTFLVENIFGNAPVDAAIPSAPPVGKRLEIEFFMSPQRTGTAANDAPISIQRVEIPNTGRVEVELPAGVPLFEVLRRPDNSIPLGRDGQIFHVGGMNFARAGGEGRCVGCHAGHTMVDMPEDPAWTNVSPGALVRATSTLTLRSGPTAPIRFEAVNLVDRRTDPVSSEWAAVGGPMMGTSQVALAWSTTLQAQRAVVYAPRSGAGTFGNRDQVINDLTVITMRDGEEQQRVRAGERIRTSGTSIELDPGIEFDTLKLVINPSDVTGYFEGSPGAALAEVEVIGRAVGEPRVSFLRGDAVCDGQINLTDAVATLLTLFRGGGGFCCMEAADANDDGSVNITDPIFILGFLFRGTALPPPPFPGCGPAHGEALPCDIDLCFDTPLF